MMAGTAAENVTLATTLKDKPHAFLQPSLPLYTDTLAYLKHTLDPLATQISRIQLERQQEARKKRKRGEQLDQEEVLRLKQVHIEGFSVEQVWEQARRVIEAAREEAERGLSVAEMKARGSTNGTREVSDEQSSSEIAYE